MKSLALITLALLFFGCGTEPNFEPEPCVEEIVTLNPYTGVQNTIKVDC